MKVDLIMKAKKKWRSNKLSSDSTSGVDKKYENIVVKNQ